MSKTEKLIVSSPTIISSCDSTDIQSDYSISYKSYYNDEIPVIYDELQYIEDIITEQLNTYGEVFLGLQIIQDRSISMESEDSLKIDSYSEENYDIEDDVFEWLYGNEESESMKYAEESNSVPIKQEYIEKTKKYIKDEIHMKFYSDDENDLKTPISSPHKEFYSEEFENEDSSKVITFQDEIEEKEESQNEMSNASIPSDKQWLSEEQENTISDFSIHYISISDNVNGNFTEKKEYCSDNNLTEIKEEIYEIKNDAAYSEESSSLNYPLSSRLQSKKLDPEFQKLFFDHRIKAKINKYVLTEGNENQNRNIHNIKDNILTRLFTDTENSTSSKTALPSKEKNILKKKKNKLVRSGKSKNGSKSVKKITEDTAIIEEDVKDEITLEIEEIDKKIKEKMNSTDDVIKEDDERLNSIIINNGVSLDTSLFLEKISMALYNNEEENVTPEITPMSTPVIPLLIKIDNILRISDLKNANIYGKIKKLGSNGKYQSNWFRMRDNIIECFNGKGTNIIYGNIPNELNGDFICPDEDERIFFKRKYVLNLLSSRVYLVLNLGIRKRFWECPFFLSRFDSNNLIDITDKVIMNITQNKNGYIVYIKDSDEVFIPFLEFALEYNGAFYFYRIDNITNFLKWILAIAFRQGRPCCAIH